MHKLVTLNFQCINWKAPQCINWNAGMLVEGDDRERKSSPMHKLERRDASRRQK